VKKVLKKREFFENLGMGQPCPSKSLWKRKVLCRKLLEASGDKNVFEKLWWLSTWTGPSQCNHITLKWEGA
jgi:hypothetical protein